MNTNSLKYFKYIFYGLSSLTVLLSLQDLGAKAKGGSQDQAVIGMAPAHVHLVGKPEST